MFSTSKMMHIYLLVLTLMIAPSFTHFYARSEISTYQEVKNEYLKTLAYKKKEIVGITQGQENKKQIKLIVEELSKYVQHDLVSSMFIQHGTLQKQNHVIDSNFIRKIELLCGGETPQENLLEHLNPRDGMSIFGKTAFASILINPTDNIAELHKRQKIVASLNNFLQNETINQGLTEVFEAIKQAQAEAIRYWYTEPEINKELFQRLYWKQWFKGLNKNTAALEIATRIRNLTTSLGISWPAFYIILTNSLNIYMHEKFVQNKENISKRQVLWKSFKKIKEQINGFSPYLKTFKNNSYNEIRENFEKKFRLVKPELKDVLEFSEQIHPKTFGDQVHIFSTSPMPLKVAMIAIPTLLTHLWIHGTKTIIDMARLNTAATNHIHERLIAVATCVRQAKNLYTLLKQDEATANMPAVQKLATFFEKNAQRSNNLSRLLDILQTNTFRGSPSFFTITGRVLAGHTLMNETKNELIPLFESIGHIEAYSAAAKLYGKHKELPAKFCFAEFVEADKPALVMKNFWNPFIASETVVKNDAIFNSFGSTRNVILTGPNTAGKSTIGKGIAINLVLAQTFGICASDMARLTPFSIINCHLNITDDIATGTSLFHAEVKRAKELLNDIQSLPRNKFCFTLMDEVFNGTNAEGGAEAAYKFSDQLGKYPNLIIVIATHFGKLTDLEQDGNFRNMHVGAHLDTHGALIRPFKLQQGIFKDPENKILNAILEKEGLFMEDIHPVIAA